ncbi:C40 family peptidase [Actinoallomurus sp. NPDC052274]|uniref:C40 family peptidase n=1 Tax=Actinoallomurus sp. NPDC052274 TaxID=3155420 RepID=UPI00343CB99D
MNEAGNNPPQPPVPAGPPPSEPPEAAPAETGEPGASPGPEPRQAAPPRGRDLVSKNRSGGGKTGPPSSEPELGGGGSGGRSGGSRGGRANPMRDAAGSNVPKPAKGGSGMGADKGLAQKAGGLGSKAGDVANKLPRKPEGKDLGEKAAHLGGQAANTYLAAQAGPMWDAAKKGLNTRAGQALLNRGPGGKLLNTRHGKRFKEGAGVSGKENKKKSGKGGRSGQPDQEAEGAGSGNGKVKALVLGGFSLPLALFLILPMILGATADDKPPGQPDGRSNSLVAKYFPDRWLLVLQQAADRAESEASADYSTVPWTVLAGIVVAQTDFARYSPYDNVDRDQGRTTPEIAPAGGTGSGDDITAGNTEGAGPEAIKGITGDGESKSIAPGHPGPPPGDLSHQLGWFMWAMRMHESSGRYDAGSRNAACGAYQYMPDTWRTAGDNYGYQTACDAPPSIQDKRAKTDFIKYWNKWHMWQSVAVKHFTGSDSSANKPSTWDQCPAACDVNPTMWGYVDDVMKKMAQAAKEHPAIGAQPAAYRPNGTTVRPADMGPRVAASSSSGSTAATADLEAVTAAADLQSATSTADRTDIPEGVLADGCPVGNPSPPIGGKGAQGSGPYLLTPSAVADMRGPQWGLDPQNPCDSSYYVARKLSYWAEKVHSDPSSPQWVADGDKEDQENARKYWSKVIEASGLFAERTAQPDAPCALPPEDSKKPWSVNFKIISIWHCEVTRMPELYLVTGGQHVDKKFTYTVEENRSAAEQTLINEALEVSYAASKWKTDKCDDKSTERQGVFPMTPQEAAKAGVADRCDDAKNIDGAAKLVLAGEAVPPDKREKKKGDFQPMVGGWRSLSIAMGKDLDMFSVIGPSTSLVASDACTKVMTAFLNKIAPLATEFAALKDPPEKDLDTWRQKLSTLETANQITEPGTDRACMVGSWSPGFNGELADLATSLAGSDAANADNLTGLGNYYQAADAAVKPTDPVVGQDPLVIPRLAPRPLKEIQPPSADDATQASANLGGSDGTTLPLSQVAIDYAWFFGGVISPFNSAGQRIGSLANGSAESTSGGAPGGGPATLGNLNGTLGERIVAWASKWIGLPYQFGGGDIHGPTVGTNSNGSGKPGFDCSGLTLYAVYNATGGQVTLAHYVPTQWKDSHVHSVSYSDLQPGDLIAMHEWGHVGIYIGGGKMIHAPHTGDVVKISDITHGWYRDVFVTGGRVTQ